jgi:hypothetical protein
METKERKMENKLNKKESLKAELLQYSELSAGDRTQVAAALKDISSTTVKRYLKGEVASTYKAERILREVKKLAA